MDIIGALGGSSKKKEILVEMLDYEYVNQSNDIDELKLILEVLQSGFFFNF